jgi:HEPN superfamily RiboL-PSP-like protein
MRFWQHERYWKLTGSPLGDLFKGTPFKNMISRLLGVTIGKRVIDDGARFYDKTLISVGDFVTLNDSVVIQGHSLDEGVFKSDFIKVGLRALWRHHRRQCRARPGFVPDEGRDAGRQHALARQSRQGDRRRGARGAGAAAGQAGGSRRGRAVTAHATTPLVAATLSRVFAALRDVNSKHPYFAGKLPDDRDLHRLARERVFIDGFEAISTQKVEISDRVIDTKSNLSSIILKRNLFQLGLDYPVVDRLGGTIDRLLGVRNAIAHGDILKMPGESEAREYVVAAFDVMRFIQNEVYGALQNRTYQRAADEFPAIEYS